MWGKKNHLFSRCLKLTQDPQKPQYQKPTPDLKRYELEFLYTRKKDSTDSITAFDEMVLHVIKLNRDIKTDLAKLYNCSPEQVATEKDNLTIEQLTSGDIVCYYGHMVFPEVGSFNTVTFPKFVSGSLIFKNLQNIDGIKLPQYIGGGLSLTSLESISGFYLIMPEYVGGEIYLDSLTSLKQIYISPNAVIGDYLYVGHQIPEQDLLDFKQNNPQVKVVYRNIKK